MIKTILPFLLMLLTVSVVAQQKQGTNPTTIQSTAVLELESTTKGFLPPRMTTTQREAITSPAEGLTVFNTTTNCLEWFDGTGWWNGCTGKAYVPNVCNPAKPTAIIEVVSTTGKTWMDRNLGAARAATSSTDKLAYGSSFQWGRAAEGHQCTNRISGDGIVTSGNTTTKATTSVPTLGNSWDGLFIKPNSPYDWLTPQNATLWQGVSGTNNPCPSGFRLPTETELDAERAAFATQNAAGAFASPLKLAVAGERVYTNASPSNEDVRGVYWSSTVSGTDSRYLLFSAASATMMTWYRGFGYSVRCIKN